MSRTIWAIGDLHLSFGTPNKKMDIFGPSWVDHAKKIQMAWDSSIHPDDIVLIPGDISWASRPDEAMPDLQWVDERPGLKILVRGNHDYWWGSASKVRSILPKSLRIIHNDSISLDGLAIGGTRLWDSTEFSFERIIDRKPMVSTQKISEVHQDAEIFLRELHRLELSLQSIPKDAPIKIAMTHYPPIGLDLAATKASALFEQYGIHIVVFGHLHSLKPQSAPLFGTARGVSYHLCSCDCIDFSPLRISKIS